MSRFQSIGNYVYEKGERIGCTTEEAADALACKLNAYQMRVERLKAEVERLKNNCDYLDQKLDEEIDKTAMLCGQVERLIKAGDAMAKRTEFFQKRWDADELCQEVEAWNAAKEGTSTDA